MKVYVWMWEDTSLKTEAWGPPTLRSGKGKTSRKWDWGRTGSDVGEKTKRVECSRNQVKENISERRGWLYLSDVRGGKVGTQVSSNQHRIPPLQRSAILVHTSCIKMHLHPESSWRASGIFSGTSSLLMNEGEVRENARQTIESWNQWSGNESVFVISIWSAQSLS